jgi:SLT domain-containing protein
MGAKREYVAIFAIGGKLLGSFKGAMTAANARLAGVRKTATAAMGSIKRLALSFGLLTSAVAAFGISKVLSGLFEGAAEQAKEARQRINATIAAFMQLDKVRAKGVDYAKAQLDVIYKQNEVLGKQGVLHTDIFNEMTKQLALGGVPPRQIKYAMEAMGDLLVKARGVNATEEDAAEFSKAYVRALHGKTKALEKFFIYINPFKGEGKNRIKKSVSEIFEEVVNLGKAQGTAGFNIARAMDPEGKLQMLQNRLQDMREEIGNRMLPAQARLAEIWLAVFTPETVDKLVDAIDWVYKQIIRLAEYIKNDLLPYLKSTEGQKKIKQLGDVFIWVGKNAKWLVPTIIALVAAMYALNAVMVVVGAISAVVAAPWALIAAAILALVGVIIWAIVNWNSFRDTVLGVIATFEQWIGQIPLIGPALNLFLFGPLKAIIKTIDWIVQNWPLIGKTISDTWEDVKHRFATAWEFLKTGFLEVGKVILQALQTPLNASIDTVNALVNAFNKINPFKKIPNIPNVGAGAPAAAYQQGGIAKTPQIAALAEGGPELVVPLSAISAGVDQWSRLQRDNTTATKQGTKLTEQLSVQMAKLVDMMGTAFGFGAGGRFGMGGGAFGGGGAGAAFAGGAAAAAATAPARAAAAQIPLGPEELKAVQAERADIIAEMQKPELQNLISATLATEAGNAEDQKNVLEALVNRAVAAKARGQYKGIESMIKGGFYGPYNRGETAAVMAKGLSESRGQQVAGFINELGAGRNVLGGLTDQGMINEIKGAIKEKVGEDYYGLQGLGGETATAAYKYSRAYKGAGAGVPGMQAGGIVTKPLLARLGERGAEAVIPLSRGGGAGATHVSFAPNITINGSASDEEQRALVARLRSLSRTFVEDFKNAQTHERRLSYESGYD